MNTNLETRVVNFFAAVAPWGAPLAPAYMTYRGMTIHLGFPVWVSLALAMVIEILGLATVHTTITFWQFNRRRQADYKKRPTEIAAGMFLFYLSIILVVNVLMEIPPAFPEIPVFFARSIPIVARAFLSLLTVPAAVILAIRAQHNELMVQPVLKHIETTETKKKLVSETGSTKKKQKVLEILRKNPETPTPAIVEAVDVSSQYVNRLRSSTNGNGKDHV